MAVLGEDVSGGAGVEVEVGGWVEGVLEAGGGSGEEGGLNVDFYEGDCHFGGVV